MKELKKIDVLSAGKISAILMLIFGVIVAIFMIILSIFVFIYSVVTRNYEVFLGIIEMFIMVLLLIAFYVAVGYIMGIIYAAIYNFIARKWGGLKIELK